MLNEYEKRKSRALDSFQKNIFAVSQISKEVFEVKNLTTNGKYLVNPSNWLCTCRDFEGFAQSNGIVCKHLIYCWLFI